MPRSRRPTRVYGAAVASALAVWLAFARLVAPAIIRRGYAGRSIGPINGAFRGRDVHPVERYLTHWDTLFMAATISFLAAAVVGYLLVRYRHGIGRWLDAQWRGRGAPLARGDFLLLAVFIGLLCGCAEAIGAIGKSVALGMPHYGSGYSPEIAWMSPLANAIVFGAFASLIVLATIRMKGPVPVGGAVLLLAGGAAFVALRSYRLGAHPAAIALLSLGVAVQSARWAERNGRGVVAIVRRGTPAILLVLLGVAAAIAFESRAGFPTAGMKGRHPNLVLIILDTVRSRNLSLYGHTRSTTPFLDGLAGESAVFDHAVTTASWTLPSHASIFTGQYPYAIGANSTARFDGRYPTLAEVLGEEGYRTGGFVANMFYAGARSGLARGFQYYDDWPITLPMLVSNSWLARSIATFVTGRPVVMQAGAWGFKHAAQVNRSFFRWLDDDDGADRPFFAFLNYLDAHHPYPVPPPWDTHFSGPLPPPRSWDAMFTAREQSQLTDAYDNAIAYLDSEVDSIFAGLDRRGMLDNTVVVIASDHGEQFGEQRRKARGHGNSLYAPLLDVPLIIHAPGAGVPATRIGRTITLRDLPATIMDLLSLREVSPFPGESLASIWEPGEEEFRGSPVFSELGLENSFRDTGPEWRSWEGHMRSITGERFHYIANGDGTEELYDREADPWELRDLSADPRVTPQLDRMRARLIRVRPLTRPSVVAGND